VPTAAFSLTLKEHGEDVMDGALFTWPTVTETDAVVVIEPESVSATVSEYDCASS